LCAVAASLPTPGEKPRSIFLGFVAPDVLARYVGVYNGNYLANKRTIEVSLSGGQLIAKIIGAAAVDGGEMRQLVPLSQTEFEGLGIGYRFIVDDKGSRRTLWRLTIRVTRGSREKVSSIRRQGISEISKSSPIHWQTNHPSEFGWRTAFPIYDKRYTLK